MLRLLSLLSVVTLSACSASPDSTASSQSALDKPYKMGVRVSYLEPIIYGKDCNVHFEATNNGNDRIPIASLTWTAANEAGETIADGLTVISNLMPNKTQPSYHTLTNVRCDDVKAIKNMTSRDDGGELEVIGNSSVPLEI